MASGSKISRSSAVPKKRSTATKPAKAARQSVAERSASDWREIALIARMELDLIRQEKSTMEAIEIGLPEEAQALRERLAAIESSQSWRMTAPVRALVTRVRQFRERLRGVKAATADSDADSADEMLQRTRKLAQHCDKATLEAWKPLLSNSGKPE